MRGYDDYRLTIVWRTTGFANDGRDEMPVKVVGRLKLEAFARRIMWHNYNTSSILPLHDKHILMPSGSLMTRRLSPISIAESDDEGKCYQYYVDCVLGRRGR